MKISVVVPVFDERNTIKSIMDRIKAVPLDKEIIVVDDFSSDGTRDILSKMNGDMVKVIFHEKNMGKGAALRTGFNNVTNDIVIVQDADLEYDPGEYHN